MLPIHGICFGPQGEGDVRRRLQPEGPALGVQQRVHPQPPPWIHLDGKGVVPEYDPSAHDLDGEVVMRAGGGKKHGRFWIGDGTIDTASTPTLSRFEHGALVPARRYAHDWTLHGSR